MNLPLPSASALAVTSSAFGADARPDLHATCFARVEATPATAIETLFAAAVEGSRCRRELFDDAAFQSRVLAYLDAQHARAPIRALTFDVFDTVVLRNGTSEARRFWEIAHRQAQALASAGVSREAEDLFVARLMATRASYRLRRPVEGCREGSIEDIYRGVCAALGLDEDTASLLLDIELVYEIEGTEPNPLAVVMAQWAQRNGAMTALISDMYLHAPQIERIVSAHLGAQRELFGELTSSADTLINKGSGRLFDRMAKAHELDAGDHLHVGDNAHTDYRSPLGRGWRAYLLPVPLAERQGIEADHEQFVAELDACGMSLGAWIKSGA